MLSFKTRSVLHTIAPTAAALIMASSPAKAPFVVAYDGVAAPSELSSKEFLLNNPNGAYTTARTCCQARRLFEWTTHTERTAASVEALVNGAKTEADSSELVATVLATLATPSALSPRLDATVSSAMRAYVDAHGCDTELKVTVLVSWREQCAASVASAPAAGQARPLLGSVGCHVAPLPPLPTSPVRVEVRGAPRANALAKDSAWVADRAPLEELMRASSAGALNELLLVSEGGELLEGSQTNFYALADGAVITAGEGVLAGTVRRLLLEVCAREGIPVILRPPRLDEIGSWEGALISSTSRLMLPIDQLYVPAEGRPSGEDDLRAEFNTAPGSLAARLQELVAGEVVAHSTQLI
mmetsp:Transcript_51557/g.118434  ORF Transcript_51557/g.118434 Transcript_51557/m.118434 type:complete len:356 (-) Transcript_51557:244-1311(-)